MKTIGLLTLVIFLTAGCSKELVDFVSAGPKRPTVDLPSTSTSSNPVGIRVTPGANQAAGTTVQGRFAITTSSKPVQGSQLKGTISFHQNRPN